MQFKPQKVQILTFFEGKILTIFSKRSAILDNFPLQKVKNMGKFFHNFFDGWGKNIFFWQNIHLCSRNHSISFCKSWKHWYVGKTIYNLQFFLMGVRENLV